MSFNSGMISSKSREWETPHDFFTMLDEIFHFTVDVCANFKNYKVKKYWTEHDNSLKKKWIGVCWMNPPYSREIIKWVRKAFISSRKYGSTIVCLLPARTDTAWFHDYCMKGSVYFIRGRLTFVLEDASISNAPFPSMLVIFSPKENKRRYIGNMQRNFFRL